MYGFYSKGQAQRAGTLIYLNEDNEEVKVTAIQNSPTPGSTTWDDAICIGIVTEFVKRVDYGSLGKDGINVKGANGLVDPTLLKKIHKRENK